MAAETDPLDGMLAQLVGGGGGGQAFYDALVQSTLYVVLEKETGAAPAQAAVFAHRVQDGRKIIDVYTSAGQAEASPEARLGRPVHMPARELFRLIAQTGCDVGLNTYSGHGGLLPAAKVAELGSRP